MPIQTRSPSRRSAWTRVSGSPSSAVQGARTVPSARTRTSPPPVAASTSPPSSGRQARTSRTSVRTSPVKAGSATAGRRAGSTARALEAGAGRPDPARRATSAGTGVGGGRAHEAESAARSGSRERAEARITGPREPGSSSTSNALWLRALSTATTWSFTGPSGKAFGVQSARKSPGRCASSGSTVPSSSRTSTRRTSASLSG